MSRCETAASGALQKNAHLVGLDACCKKCVVPHNDRRRFSTSRETSPMYEEKRFRARARQIHLYVPGKVGDRKPRFPYHLHAHLAFWSPGLEVATFSNTWPSSLGAFCKKFGRGFPFRVSNSCAAPNSKDLLPVLYFSLTQLFALFVKMCLLPLCFLFVLASVRNFRDFTRLSVTTGNIIRKSPDKA